MIANLATAILKDPVYALVIFGAVLINAFIGYIQAAQRLARSLSGFDSLDL